MLLRRDLERIAEHRRATMRSRPESHDLRTERDRSIVRILCAVMERDADGHGDVGGAVAGMGRIGSHGCHAGDALALTLKTVARGYVVWRRRGEKRLVNRVADKVQPCLEAVDELVNPAADNLLD